METIIPAEIFRAIANRVRERRPSGSPSKEAVVINAAAETASVSIPCERSRAAVGLELEAAEAYFLLAAFDAEEDRLQLLADVRISIERVNPLGSRELGDVNEAFDPFLDLSERAVRDEVGECRK